MSYDYKTLEEKQDFFLCNRVNTLEDLRKTISDLSEAKYIFRGVNESRYTMKTSLQVHWQDIIATYPHMTPELYIAEMVERLRDNSAIDKYYNEINSKISKTDFSILALMQHYGVPTPLLDWTPNMSIALNFAFERYGQEPVFYTDIDRYVSVYYIDMQRNREFTNCSIQNILRKGQDQVKDIKERHPTSIDMSNTRIDRMLRFQEIPRDFAYVSYEEDAPLVNDLWGNIFSIINPNLQKQQGGFILNWYDDSFPLEKAWCEKLKHAQNIPYIDDEKNICDGKYIYQPCGYNNKARSGVLPTERIHCLDIERSVLEKWIKEGNQLELYDNSLSSKSLKDAINNEYQYWLHI